LDISLQSDSASKSKAQGVALLDAFFDRRVNAHSSYNGLALGEIHGGSGYLSMNPKELHFGLGSAESAQLQITWPNGEQQRLGPLPANRTHTVRQGAQGE
jgi:hypothetical protein